MITIAEALNIKIATEKVTQVQFASNIGIPAPLLSMLLSGRRNPSLDVVKKIYRKYPDLVEVLLS